MPAARGCRVAKLFAVIVVAAVMVVAGVARAVADVPGVVDFQGTIADGAGVPLTGQAAITFSLYTTAAGGEPVWQETQAVAANAGIYSTALGSVTPFPEALWERPELWLGIRQEGAEELPQRVRIVAVPYALRAKTAESLAGGGSAVPAGAMVLSDKAADPALLNAGFVEVYSVRPECWRLTSSANPPHARRYHTAVWTGTRMIVWGGQDSTGYTAYGRLYDPLADCWAPTPTVNAPTMRLDHTAVWTGALMVVWGGRYNDPSAGRTYVTDTGASYAPGTHTWSAMTTAGAPQPRERHTAVWTGSRMIVWGGYSSGFLSTGGMYDPATNTWTPTSMTNAPTARDGHTAVWTGSRMIVWGGGNPLTVTGCTHDPVANTWTAMSTTNAPTGRRGHTAVWTGSRMIVWGGNTDVYSPTNSGGVYDPTANTWQRTSTVGAPFARYNHTAVWTGSRMVIWGGNTEAGETDTGAAYDPETDTWTPIAVPSGLTPRAFHTALWTGNSMIVWGGYRDDVPGLLSTGGVYTPANDRLLYVYQRP